MGDRCNATLARTGGGRCRSARAAKSSGETGHGGRRRDSLEFEHKYRSIVIAWAPEDRPTDAQVSPGRGRSRSPRAGSSGRLQPGKNDCR